MSCRLRFALSFLALAAFSGAAEPAQPAPASSPPPVKLAVVLVVDQLRADYLVKFRPYFGEGGFKRMLEGGTDYRNNHFRHALTVTAPGHATVLTGVHANVHGILANDWFDRTLGDYINNVEDRAAPLVGADPGIRILNVPKAGRSPRNLKAATVSDQLKLRFGSDSKVFAAANKDRSAILLGGQRADAAYWDEYGEIVTSRYYRATLPTWIVAFNQERRVLSAYGRTWERLLEPSVYEKVQGPDDAPGETVEYGMNRVFPKRITGGRGGIDADFFTAFDRSPFSAEFLGDFVQRAIKEEKLGRNTATDMLCVSFAQIDSIGHSYGPDSHEVMDSMIRLDRVLAGIFDTIDREVGLAHCVFVLTADHGIPPLTEKMKADDPASPAVRVRTADMDAPAARALDAAFGPLPPDTYWFARANPGSPNSGYHILPAALEAKKLKAEDVAKVLKEFLAQQPIIAAAYTRAELVVAEPAGDDLLAKVRRSYYNPSDRDVIYVLKPHVLDNYRTGVPHGSPYDYDTHVPQVWFGRGVARGVVSQERVGVDDIAPTLSGLLGLPAPPQAQGRRLF